MLLPVLSPNRAALSVKRSAHRALTVPKDLWKVPLCRTLVEKPSDDIITALENTRSDNNDPNVLHLDLHVYCTRLIFELIACEELRIVLASIARPCGRVISTTQRKLCTPSFYLPSADGPAVVPPEPECAEAENLDAPAHNSANDVFTLRGLLRRAVSMVYAHDRTKHSVSEVMTCRLLLSNVVVE